MIHTAFEEYVFLVVENQMIAEMDKKLNSTLEAHLKKGYFFNLQFPILKLFIFKRLLNH